MYALALTLSAGTAAVTTGLPYFHLGAAGPIQAFGVIVAAGVLIGAAILRRYGEWHGVSDEHIRGLTGWITVCGFIGAHLFDTLAYEWDRLMADPLLIVKVWDGISSYGGFLGGGLGFAFYVWWKRLPARLMADISIVGLLPAFTIGRIGCTVVSDHVGAPVANPDAWYAFLAMDYPRTGSNTAHLFTLNPGAEHVLAWNLGLIEFLYLVPVNAIVLGLAFRAAKRTPAGLATALTGLLYAPVRFFLDYMRPETSDPRHYGLTFAQWVSLLAFAIALYTVARVLANGEPHPVVAPTAREAQQRLREAALAGDDDDDGKAADGKAADGGAKSKAKASAK